MLRVKGATTGYGTSVVLREVSLGVDPGELVCVVGPNGAGKTTLLRLCAGFLSPTRGSVRCFDTDPAHAPRHRLARRLAYLPQMYRLAFPFSVSEVVLMGRYAHRRAGWLGLEDDADVAAAINAMERCEVAELRDRRFDELSGGEQRRVLLAQALCQDAELILLDEPTASLDPAHAIAVFEALTRDTESSRSAALVVTHDLNLAARYATRIVVLDHGRVAAEGAPDDVLATAATRDAFGVSLHIGRIPPDGPRFVVPR